MPVFELTSVTAGRSGEDAILARQRHGPDGSLDRVVVALDAAILEEPPPFTRGSPRIPNSPPGSAKIPAMARAWMIPSRGSTRARGSYDFSRSSRAALRPRMAALSVSEIGRRLTWVVSESIIGSSVPSSSCAEPTVRIASISASSWKAAVS